MRHTAGIFQTTQRSFQRGKVLHRATEIWITIVLQPHSNLQAMRLGETQAPVALNHKVGMFSGLMKTWKCQWDHSVIISAQSHRSKPNSKGAGPPGISTELMAQGDLEGLLLNIILNEPAWIYMYWALCGTGLGSPSDLLSPSSDWGEGLIRNRAALGPLTEKNREFVSQQT